jgi:hypothetical protein
MSGEDIGDKLQRLVGDHANLKVTASGMKGFQKLSKPISPCFVVMQRLNTVPHCALFIDGRIFHLKESGVEFRELSLAKWSYTNMRFYKSI